MRILGKIVRFLGNVIGVVLSLVLSVALLGMLIATPMLSGVSALTRPETISQVVKEIDFAQFFLDSFRGEMSEEERLEMEFVVELTETNAFDELVELYAVDISNLFEETVKPSVLTKEALRKIVQDNMDEVLRIIRKIGENEGGEIASYTDEELEAKIWEAFDELADKFLEMAPTVDDLRNLIGKFSDELSTDSSSDNERPNSSTGFEEDIQDEYVEGGKDQEGGSITYMPGEGGSITTIIVGPDGVVQSGEGGFSYYVDPETGAIVFQGGEGSATSSGGKLTFGKAVATNNGTVRVLLMSIAPSGGAQEGTQPEEIVDTVLKLARMAKNGTLTLLFVGVIVVLALLICLLRWPRFKGVMWVAVMLLIGAGLVALVGVAYTVLPGIIAEQGGQAAGIISAAKPAIKIITNSMFIAAGVYAGVAIVLIVLFAIFRKLLRKQKSAKAAVLARKEAVAEIAEEAEAVALEAPEVTCEEEPEEIEESPAEAESILSEEAEIPAEEEMPFEEEEVPLEEEEVPLEEKKVPSEEELLAE